MSSLNEVNVKLGNDDDDESLSVATTIVEEEENHDLEIDHGEEMDDNDHEELPLWYYQRQKQQQQEFRSNDTTIPYCTTSVMGKVILNATTSIWTPTTPSTSTSTSATVTILNASSQVSSTATTTNINISDVSESHEDIPIHEEDEEIGGRGEANHVETPILPPHTWFNQTVYIVVGGYSNGRVGITEATTNATIVDTTITTSTAVVNDTSVIPTSNNVRPVESHSIGNNVTDTGWYVTTNNDKISPIVSVSIDATGTVITAIDTNGYSSIWTVKYSIVYEPEQLQQQNLVTSTSSTAVPPTLATPKAATSGNLLSKLFWRNTTSTTSTTTTNEPTTPRTSMETPKRMVPTLAMTDVKVIRLQPYNETMYGIPTGICLDPQFVNTFRFIVTFTSGKIVVTSRNWMRRYEEHTILPYFNSILPKEAYIGIETIVWRSSFIAFADCSGISLYDIQSFKPLARVDRPIGAQPSLYHFMNPFTNNMDDGNHSEKMSTRDESQSGRSTSVARIQPHLYFETSRSLLVAWGDCLMTLSITDMTTTSTVVEQQSAARSTNTTSGPAPTSSTRDVPPQSNNPMSSVRKRTVACTMAWALDGIVATDVVPVDERHVAILGYIVADDNDDEAANTHVDENGGSHTNQRIIPNPYEMELQIVDRTNGSILHSDLLRLQQPNISSPSPHLHTNFNQNCRLLSSFAVPRMDDLLELKEERGDHVIGMMPSAPKYIDCHLRWSLNMVSFPTSMSDVQNNNETSKYDVDDTDSVDSDDYDFLVNATKSAMPESSENGTISPPTLLIVSDSDMVLARIRDVDDAIHFALEHHRPALALFWALKYRTRQLRRYTMDDLINVYLRSLLRIPITNAKSSPIGKRLKQNSSSLGIRKLSLRRMTLAAQSLPILLGGNVAMWKTWIIALEKIPGALFVARKYIPVRDPKLPKSLYVRVLSKMLEEVEAMRISLKPDMSDRLVVEAEGHFLSSLLAWGTTRGLTEHLKLFKYQTNLDNSHENEVRRTIESLRFRNEQSAVGYLDPLSPSGIMDHATGSDIHLVNASNTNDNDDSLYNVDDAFDMLSQRITIITYNAPDDEKAMTMNLPTRSESNSRVVIDGMAKIHIMKNAYDEALRCLLVLSALHSIKSLEDIEQDALKSVNENMETVKIGGAYSFVLHLIEIHHLHQFLLETSFLPDGINCSPICALIRLVGLELAGEFLMQNCTAPQQAVSKKSNEERRGTLPLDLVADQLSGNQKLFHWYLHVLSIKRPELYVKFPTTANPPPVIATLHRKHLDLYIRYAGPNRDSTQVLENVEAYMVTERTTPLLSFLKVVLQLGTIGAIEVAKLLEIERRGGAGVSHTFALELAYILENYGNNTEADALLILELFLEGARSLMLAVSFAQRTKPHSTKLWEKLIAHCLLKSSFEKTSDGSFSGMLFGSLLEAAALSGADLSQLVAQIPKGMQVEGLRPRLIAAVADYRLKVQLHSKSCEIAIVEKRALFIESTLRCRRGMRYENSSAMAGSINDENNKKGSAVGVFDEGIIESPSILSTQLRPRSRLDRYTHSLQIPIR